jgi:pSer/pThr/pTyr-binding forkhead associated (FHA) protein
MPTLIALSDSPDIAVDGELAVIVGRHPKCHARLDSEQVSRRHCILIRDGEDVVVKDIGSQNGTWINGRRVKNGRLEPGDEITIKPFRYRLAREEADSKEAAVRSNAKKAECGSGHYRLLVNQ